MTTMHPIRVKKTEDMSEGSEPLKKPKKDKKPKGNEDKMKKTREEEEKESEITINSKIDLKREALWAYIRNVAHQYVKKRKV